MVAEPFAHGRSFIHRVDPRIRLAAAVGCAVCLAVLRHVDAACLGLALAVTLLACSKPPWRLAAKRIAFVNGFVLLLWLTVPFTTSGEALAGWGPLTASRQGVALALLVTAKTNAIAMLFTALVATMPPAALGLALERLRCPSKLVFLLLFAYRYMHSVTDEWQKLSVAAKLRGFAPRTSMHSYRTFGNMLAMLFLRSLDRSARVYEAMLLRGFSGNFRSLAEFHASAGSIVFAATVFSATGGIMLYDLYAGYLP